MEVTVGGVPVHYAEHGSGMPVLALNGAGADHREVAGALEPVFGTVAGCRRLYPGLPVQGNAGERRQVPEHRSQRISVGVDDCGLELFRELAQRLRIKRADGLPVLLGGGSGAGGCAGQGLGEPGRECKTANLPVAQSAAFIVGGRP
jgi:hypothetical protein